MMRRAPMMVVVVSTMAFGCGGASTSTTPTVVIPAQAPAPTATPDLAVADSGAPSEPVADKPHALPPGSDGPADAIGMIGDAGKIFPTTATTVMLVNNAAMRAHPMGTRTMQLITTVMVGWDQFMPIDLVPPVRDLEWVLLSGTLVLGSTQSAMFVSRYNVSETKADAVAVELTKRFTNGKKTQLGVPGVKSFTAVVDGTERAYLRPKTGVLAIVPSADGKRVAEQLAKTDLPMAVRPGELARVSWPRASRSMLPIPHQVTALRIWINGTSKDELTIAAEGDCVSATAAEAAVDDLRTRLRASAPGIARTMLRAFIDDAAIWSDFKTVRYEAKIPEAMLDAFVAFACLRFTGKTECAP